MIGISNGVSHRFTEDGQRQFGYISLFLSEVGHVRNALALDVYAIVVNPDDKDAPCELAGMTLRRVRGSQHRIHAGLARHRGRSGSPGLLEDCNTLLIDQVVDWVHDLAFDSAESRATAKVWNDHTTRPDLDC